MAETYYLLSFIGAGQGTLLGLAFIIRKGYHLAARMLGLFLLVFSLGLLERFVGNSLSGVMKEIVGGLMGFSNLLYGPLLYLFVVCLIKPAQKFRARHIYHILPFIVGYLVQLTTLAAVGNGKDGGDDMLEFILFEGLVIQVLSYNVIAIRKLTKYRQQLLQTYSSLGAKDLNWLKFFLVFLTGIYVLSFATTHLIAFGVLKGQAVYLPVQLSITISIYLMSYRVLFQQELFTMEPALLRNDGGDNTINTSISKYQRSGLKAEQARDFLSVLLDYMDDKKPHLDPELSIYNLSEKLGISRNHLTQIINVQLGKNFFEFINTYRVETVEVMLKNSEYEQFTLLAIGLKAGFKSKTAFYTNFKKMTGYTPTAWKKNLQTSGDFKAGQVPT